MMLMRMRTKRSKVMMRVFIVGGVDGVKRCGWRG